MTFTAWSLPTLLALILNSGIGIYVLRRNPRKPANRAFAAWMASFAVWASAEIMLRSADDAAGALFWAKAVYLGVFFLGPSYAGFVFRIAEKRFSTALLYLPWALFLPLLLTDLFVKGVYRDAFGYHTVYGSLFPVFGVPFMLLILYAWYILWRAGKGVKSPLARRRLRLMLYPAIATILLGGITNVVLPVLGVYVLSLAAPLSVLIALGTAYAFLLKE